MSRQFKVYFMVAAFFICGSIIYKEVSQTSSLPQISLPKPSYFYSEDINECRSTCTSEICVNIAKEIINRLDKNADPCTNFYSFACGGLHEKLGKEVNCSVVEIQTDYMYNVMKDAIQKASGSAGSITDKLKTAFESCINEESSYMMSIRTLLKFLDEIGFPDWPNLNSDFTFKNSSLEKAIATLISYNEKIFFDFEVFSIDDSPTINLEIPRKIKDRSPKELEFIILEILKHMDVKILNENQIVEDYIQVHNSILMLYKENDKRYCSENMPMKVYVNCTQETARDQVFICNVLKSFILNINLESLRSDGYEISCTNFFYMEKIVPLMHNYTQRSLANYMVLEFAMNNFQYLSLSLRRKLKYYLANEFTEIKMDKNIFCTEFVMEYMPYNLATVILSDILPRNATEDVHEVFEDIINQVVSFISEQNWMEENVKERVSNEIRKIDDIFYKQSIKVNELTSMYEQLDFNPVKDNFFRNVLYCKKLLKKAGMSNFIDLYRFQSLFQAGAGIGIGIHIGVALLLPPFFHNGMDKFFRYATIGQVLSHEFGHMLSTLMSSVQENFEEKLSCFNEQYSEFSKEIIGENVTWINALEEVYSDDVGLKVSEKLAQRYLRNTTENFLLPGLPYSAEEIFYILQAQIHCSIMSKEKIQEFYDRGYYNLGNFRVAGTYQNSEIFSQTFNCKPGAFMNPERKCSVLDF